MRKLILGVLLAALLLSGCNKGAQRQVSMEEIAEAYEQAGYQVACKYYDQPMQDGGIGYLQAEQENGDYIYFRFFASEEDAGAYTDTVDHGGILYFFSVLFGDPTWQRVKTYGSISVTYFDSEDYEPFEKLLDKS